MSRLSTFRTEAVSGMRGLTSLTEPGEDEPVGAIVDVAVIGGRGDGKTQFIVHAIRTLRAYAPLLEGAEHQYNRDVLQVVMNAREPRPEATAPGVVPHYVFRIRPGSLLSQVGFLGRLALYARVAGLWLFLLLCLVNAAALGAALAWLRGGFDPVAGGAAAAVFALGALLSVAFARRRFVRRGDIEIVFWDVAGEHVYSGSAADYYSFLSALVRARRQRASAARSYAFAPVLICNPVGLGSRVEGSSYARLKQLMPLFASLNEPLPRAMVAINRWTVVKKVCAPDSDRDEIVAVVSQSRAALEQAAAGEDATEVMAMDAVDMPREPVPAVKREVLRKHCLDAEDGMDNDVHLSYLRYDAGIQCEFHERPWDWSTLQKDSAIATRWRAPTSASPDVALDYVYEDGPGSFTGEVRRGFLNWLAQLAFHEASYGRDRAGDRAIMDARAGEAPGDAAFVKKRPAQVVDDTEPERRLWPEIDGEATNNPDVRAGERGLRDTEPEPRAEPAGDMTWRPKPLSAKGLEEFARGTIATDEVVSAAIDASLGEDEGNAEARNRGQSEFKRERTSPGIGPGNAKKRAATPALIVDDAAAPPDAETVILPDAAVDSPDPVDATSGRAESDATASNRDAEPARSQTATLRMPGGFGSGGT